MGRALVSLLLGATCAQGPCTPGQRAKDCGEVQDCVTQVGMDAGHVDAGAAQVALECTPGEARCVAPARLQTCALGRWAFVDCGENGLQCRDGACVAALCSGDGGARCVDLMTLQRCSPAGELQDCAGNQTCWHDRCGLSAGAPCATHDVCAGGYCHCAAGACDGGALKNGYCSLLGCNTQGGNPCPASEVCMGLSSAGGGRQNLCGSIATTTCPESTHGMPPGYPGPFKRWMPIPVVNNLESYSYGAPVCFDAYPGAVGAACVGDTQCLGGSAVGFLGQCLPRGGGLCTHACDVTHPCPPGAACAHRPQDGPGTGVCLLGCSDQHPGLAQCDRPGLTCQVPGQGFAVLDGRQDPLGFCF